jgi:lactoylglutathione lyase
MDVIHTAIPVSDLDAMREFYVDALGLEENHSFTYGGVENVFVGGEDGELQFRYDPERETPVAPDRDTLDHFAVSVEAVDSAFEALVAATDCPVVTEPTTIDAAGVRVAFVEDPEGYVLELVEDL